MVLTRSAAEAALPSLLGMALDYAPAFDRHDARRKVGVITRAEIVGRCVEVGGYLYAKDFPEIVSEISRSSKNGIKRDCDDVVCTTAESVSCHEHALLGMSYEIADAQVADLRAKVWTLTKVTFTGAAILRRNKAAYQKTWIELED